MLTRPNGTRQWAYLGYALYTYDGDEKQGDTRGHDSFEITDPNSALYWRDDGLQREAEGLKEYEAKPHLDSYEKTAILGVRSIDAKDDAKESEKESEKDKRDYGDRVIKVTDNPEQY